MNEARKQWLAKRPPSPVIITVSLIALLAALATGFYFIRQHRLIGKTLDVETFYDGIYVDGVHVGGLTPSEAMTALAPQQQQRAETVNITLRVDGTDTRFTADELAVAFDTEQVLEQAWEMGRQGNRNDRYEYVTALTANPEELYTTLSVDPAPLTAWLAEVAALYHRDPVNAAVAFSDPDPLCDSHFTYTQESDGLEVDIMTARHEIAALLESRQWDRTVTVPLRELEPEIRTADLKAATRLIARYEVSFQRSYMLEENIRLACSKISGTVILPGEEFSFNKAIGLTSGFSIIQSDHDIASSINRVAGTLYNALIMADMTITERTHHPFPMAYIAMGQDAMVDTASGIDLKCINSSDYPVYLVTYVMNDQVVAEVYGMPLPDGMTIEIQVDTLEIIEPGEPVYVADPDIPQGSEHWERAAHKGLRCQSYKVYKDKDGHEIRREKLMLDCYEPYSGEIHVNPADMPDAGDGS